MASSEVNEGIGLEPSRRAGSTNNVNGRTNSGITSSNRAGSSFPNDGVTNKSRKCKPVKNISEKNGGTPNQLINRNGLPAGFEPRRTSTVLLGLKSLKNIRLFTACISVILMLDGAMTEYTSGVTVDLGRRYIIPEHEQQFIGGVKVIGFVVTLIFVGLLGNRFNKPHAIAAGCVNSVVGVFLHATSVCHTRC